MKILLALAILATSAHAQTWVKVASEGDTLSVPTIITLRYGAAKGTPYGCGTGPALAADAWVTPKTATAVTTAGLGVIDPANCYVKELDVLQTSAAQILTVNGKSVTVPALVVVVVTPPAPTVNTITFSTTINFNGTNVSATCSAPVVKQ